MSSSCYVHVHNIQNSMKRSALTTKQEPGCNIEMITITEGHGKGGSTHSLLYDTEIHSPHNRPFLLESLYMAAHEVI